MSTPQFDWPNGLPRKINGSEPGPEQGNLMPSHEAEVGPECWAQWQGSDAHLNACQQAVEGWLNINEHEAGQLTGFLSYLPVAIGVILGVPIVARELELRTVSFAWSLQGIRWR